MPALQLVVPESFYIKAKLSAALKQTITNNICYNCAFLTILDKMSAVCVKV